MLLAYGLGRVASPPDPRDHPFALHAPEAAASTPPPAYAPKYLYTVLDQGQTPRCVGYSGALGRQIETVLEDGQALVFDPDDLYSICKTRDGDPTGDGTFIRVAAQVLLDTGGLVKQTLSPLTPADLRALAASGAFPDDVLRYIHELITWLEELLAPDPPAPPAPTPTVGPFNVGDRVKVQAYARLIDPTEFKQAIATYGDAWVGSAWMNSWFTPNADGTLPVPDYPAGGHAYRFVGYDDARGAFLVQNSWGLGWGLAGHAWMPYSYIDLGNPEWEGWRTF